MRKDDLLDALEPDQISSAKQPYGRRPLSRGTRVLMWGLRIYVVVSLAAVAVSVVRALSGG